ncbi:hypothetical protein RHMOL_Rhmol02G0311400 [Rhododendron molle]|uniref:Uncharacterized protein n=1 Tax=Rhododendron molle TaxID=49168 RepID=A0ACC0PYM6_RHOML|nr:hypothetical protein RHMOL_Rhmol02G0311400 [Rhododendron molle]
MRKAEKAVLGMEGGTYLSGFAMPHDRLDDLRRRGYHIVSGAVDVGLFRSAAVEDVRKFKSSLAEESGDEEEAVEGGKESDDDDDEKYWSE